MINSVCCFQGFTREPQATMVRDGTVSPAVGGNVFGSHCRGNGIPRSLFSVPVGTGKNGSYASDAGWERDGNCYMRGMGTGTGTGMRIGAGTGMGTAANSPDADSFLLTKHLVFLFFTGGSNSITYFHTPEVRLSFPTPAPTTITTVFPTVIPTLLQWLSRRRSRFIGVIGLVRHVYVVCVCAVHACSMGAANARVGVETRGWWDTCRHLCSYQLSEPNIVTDVSTSVHAGELLWEPGW